MKVTPQYFKNKSDNLEFRIKSPTKNRLKLQNQFNVLGSLAGGVKRKLKEKSGSQFVLSMPCVIAEKGPLPFWQVEKCANPQEDLNTAEKFELAFVYACTLGRAATTRILQRMHELPPTQITPAFKLITQRIDSEKKGASGPEVEKLDNIRSLALAGYAAHIQRLPETERAGAFADVFQEIGTLDACVQACPLAQLAGSIVSLPEADQKAAFHDVLEKIGALNVGAQGRLLAALASSISRLPSIHRMAAFNTVLEKAGTLDAGALGEVLAPLARCVAQIPHIHRKSALDGVLEKLHKLDACAKETPLRWLLVALSDFDQNDWQAAFNGVLTKIGTLDADARRNLLTILARCIGQLPYFYQRKVAFDGVLSQIETLDAVAQKQPLNALTNSACHLHPSHRKPAIESISSLTLS